MSILIKGMKMPKDGCHHTITIYSDGTITTGKANNYEAIEVSIPHGRLIDADKLVHKLGVSDEDIYIRDCLDEAPIVIESEE